MHKFASVCFSCNTIGDLDTPFIIVVIV